MSKITPTGVEQRFGEDEIIVSKTDTHGKLTYCNDVFLRISGYSEDECLGQPHSMIRHPDMPRSVFKLFWDTILSGKEIFAYVVNMCKNGDHYWVIAHATPTVDTRGQITGFHSSRRVPDKSAVSKIESLYRQLREEEKRNSDPRKGLELGTALLTKVLNDAKMPYDEFIWSIAE